MFLSHFMLSVQRHFKFFVVKTTEMSGVEVDVISEQCRAPKFQLKIKY